MDDLARRWNLTLVETIGRGSTSRIVRCRRADGRAAVLKLPPEPERGILEARALRLWSGHAPAVLEFDADTGALLLEAIPEVPLHVELDEIVALIDGLHRAPTDGFPPLADRVEFIFAQPRWRAGRELARSLAADPVKPVLLHGDLHSANVLYDGPRRGLVAIDPRPCVGDPAFDLVDWVASAPRLAATLGVDDERVRAWCRAFGWEPPANGEH